MTSFFNHFHRHTSDHFGTLRIFDPVSNSSIYIGLEACFPDLPGLFRPNELESSNFTLIGASGSILIFRFCSDSDLIYLDLADVDDCFRLLGQRYDISTLSHNVHISSFRILSGDTIVQSLRIDHINLVNGQLMFHSVYPHAHRRWLQQPVELVDSLDVLYPEVIVTFSSGLDAYFVGHDHVGPCYFSAPWEQLVADSYDVGIRVEILLRALQARDGTYRHRNDENVEGPNLSRSDYDVEISTMTEGTWMVSLERTSAFSSITRICIFRLDPVSCVYRYVTEVPSMIYTFSQRDRIFFLVNLQLYEDWLFITLQSTVQSGFYTIVAMYHTTLGTLSFRHIESPSPFRFCTPTFVSSFAHL